MRVRVPYCRSRASCSACNASTMVSMAACTSASVSVRSAARKTSRSDRLQRPFGDALPLVAIEFLDADQRRRRRASDRATNGGRRQGRVDDDRHVARARRKARQGLRADAVVARRPVERQIEVELGGEDALARRQAVGLGDGRRDLAEDAEDARLDAVAAVQRPHRDRRRALARQERRLARREHGLEAERAAQRADRARRVVEIGGPAGAAPVRRRGLAQRRQRQGAMLAGAGAEDRRQLEQAHVLLLAAAVVRDRVEQAGQQRRPHHRHRFRQRVGDGDDVGVGGEAARGVTRDEREGDALGEAGGARQRPQPRVARQPRRRTRRRQLQRREGLRDPVVAVDAGELLDQVRLRRRRRRASSGR